MASNIPAKLKAADLTRFIVRAAQLETAKPVISYWSEYWIVNQILAKGLHEGDPETLKYTTTLMDKLEQIKAENASNDAIIDDTAGQAYVEQFGFETFERADRAVQAGKVTKQTADTFQASATFLELVNIWGPPDAEIQAKIKYAKWNAVRIVKAVKEGKDPNETNPKREPEPSEELADLDPSGAEAQELDAPHKARQPSVVEVIDEQDQLEEKLARQSSIDQSLHPSAQVSARGSPAAKPAEFDPYSRHEFSQAAAQDDVSPLESSAKERDGSVGGGYFPEVPTFTGETQDPTLRTAPPDDTFDLGLPQQPSAPPGQHITPGLGSLTPPSVSETAAAPPQDFYRQAPAPVQPSPPAVQHFAPTPTPPRVQAIQPTHQAPLQQHIPPPVSVAAPAQSHNQQLNTDDMAIAKAQKHARWAISALNFEDAETAVRELRAALQTLGAQ